jgi:hypothetical protein
MKLAVHIPFNVDSIFAVSVARRYITLMEAQLSQAYTDERAVALEQLRSLPNPDECDYDVYVRSVESEYEDELRPILRFTMVVYLYMVFETRVSGDVSQIERIRQGNRAILKDIKTEEKCGIVKAAKIYFRDHANLDFFADEGWRQLEEIACVRHCIVHNAGVPRDSNQCDTIRALANRTWGQGQAVGLRIEDLDRPMTIDQPFLQYCLSMLEDFFKRLGIAAENKFRK